MPEGALNSTRIQDDRPKVARGDMSATEPRTLEGPITDRFSQHDSRLSAVETALQQLKLEQETQRSHTDNQMTQLEGKLDQHAEYTKKGFEHLQQEQQGLQQCIADALSHQDTRTASALDELKALILHGRGRKRASSNQTPSDDDDINE